MGQSKSLHLPASWGDAAAPTARVASASPTAPAVSQRLASGDWFQISVHPQTGFSPSKRRDACTSKGSRLCCQEGGGWCCEPVTVSGPLSPHLNLCRGLPPRLEIPGQCAHSLARDSSPESRSAAPTRQVWCACCPPRLSMHI